MKKRITERKDMFRYAKETFGTEPEYLWRSYPNNAVLRNTDNEKWYAIVMEAPKEKLGINVIGKINVLNIKCDPLMLGSLLLNDRFLPAYRMHKGR